MNANLMGMTGLCLCDKKVTIMKYPTKSKKQKTIDIMVNIFKFYYLYLNNQTINLFYFLS